MADENIQYGCGRPVDGPFYGKQRFRHFLLFFKQIFSSDGLQAAIWYAYPNSRLWLPDELTPYQIISRHVAYKETDDG